VRPTLRLAPAHAISAVTVSTLAAPSALKLARAEEPAPDALLPSLEDAAAHSLCALFHVLRSRGNFEAVTLPGDELAVVRAAFPLAYAVDAPVYVTDSSIVLRVEHDGAPCAAKITPLQRHRALHARELEMLQALAGTAGVPSVVSTLHCGCAHALLLPWYDTCLFDAVRDRAVTPLIAWGVVRAVSSAYAAAHARGILYMDLKIENVLFNAAAPADAVLADWNGALVQGGCGGGAAPRHVRPHVTPLYNPTGADASELCSLPLEALRFAVLIYFMVMGAPPRFDECDDRKFRLVFPPPGDVPRLAGSRRHRSDALALMRLAQWLAPVDPARVMAVGAVHALAELHVQRLQAVQCAQ
jgi:hypothetical protein